MRVKKILAAVSSVFAAGVLAACSAGASADAGAPAPVAAGSPVATSAPAPSSTTTPPPPATTSTTSTTTSKAKPKTTTPQPKKEEPKAAPGVPCTITSGACVDLSARKVWLLDGGKVTYGPVAMMPGKSGSTTPLGTFHVLSKVKNYHSKEFDAPMPNSVFFYPGDAFHTGSLKAYSNGCIHLSSSASLKLFNTLQVGDPVQVVR